tara:strand:- start:7450 stop:8652 length:1203 start_codon:yes stop_codon:yes gene_type:complete
MATWKKILTTDEIIAATGSWTSNTVVAGAHSMKLYVDSVAGASSYLYNLDDTTMGSCTAGDVIVYDTDGQWKNRAFSGDIAMVNTGAVQIVPGSVTKTKMENLTQGYILLGNATNKVVALDASGNGKVLIGDGTTISSVDISGDLDIDNTGAATLQSAAITAKTDLPLASIDRANDKMLVFDNDGGLKRTLIQNVGAVQIGGLSDVDVSMVSASDKFLMWDSGTSKWFANSKTEAAIAGSGANQDITALEVCANVTAGNQNMSIATDIGSNQLTIGQASTQVVITGDLTVSGTVTSVNSNEVAIGDSMIVLNSDEGGSPTEDAGIEVERGSSTNTKLRWDESNDVWLVDAIDSGGSVMSLNLGTTFSSNTAPTAQQNSAFAVGNAWINPDTGDMYIKTSD